MTGISLQASLAIGEQVLFRQLDDEAVLLDLKSGTYFGLNDVGARAWQLIIEHGRLARVRDLLVQEYDADAAQVERDLLALVTQCVARGLVELKSDAA